MTTLLKGGGAIMVVAVLGAGFAAASPARAAECGGAVVCSRSAEADIAISGWRVHSLKREQALRYACDGNGIHCRYTLDYHIDDDGNAAFGRLTDRRDSNADE